MSFLQEPREIPTLQTGVWDNWEIESGRSLGLGVRSGEVVYEGEDSMKSRPNQRQSLPAVVTGERGLSMKRRGLFLPGELESMGSRESQTREKLGFFRVSQAKPVLSWSLKRV